MSNALVPKVVRRFNDQGFWMALGGENAERYDGIFLDALLAERQPERQKRLACIDELITQTDQLLKDKEPILHAILNYRLSALIYQNIIQDGVERNKNYENIAVERLKLADKALENAGLNAENSDDHQQLVLDDKD